MLLLVVNAITAAHHKILRPPGTPGEAEARAKVIRVPEFQGSSALRARGILRINYLIAGKVETGPMVVNLLPRLEVVVADPQV